MRKVAIVHDYLNQYGGAEKVLEAIVNLPLANKFYRFYLPLMPSAVERFNFSNYDLIISSCSAYAKGIIVPQHAKHFCYCHTPTRYLWSDTFFYIESLTGIEKMARKALVPILNYLRIWDQVASQRPDYFIANSKFVAQRIEKYYHRQSKVIYPPVDLENFYLSNKTEDYYLVISRFRPYKKIDLAIQAFNELKLPLKIIGSGNDKYLRKIAGPTIEFLGNVSDKQKAEYLSKAKALIHPQEEDFGITILEAMACGRPVIAEVVSRFNENKYDQQTIRRQAEKFSKERFKKEVLEFINNKLS